MVQKIPHTKGMGDYRAWRQRRQAQGVYFTSRSYALVDEKGHEPEKDIALQPIPLGSCVNLF